MRLIDSRYTSIIVSALVLSCMGGSITIKKSPATDEIDICQPWIASRTEYDQLQRYSIFHSQAADLRIKTEISWHELNYWFIFILPTYGFLKYPSTPRISFTYVNTSKDLLQVDYCSTELIVNSGNAPILAATLQDTVDCSKPKLLSILPGGAYSINARYEIADFEEITKIRVKYKTSKANDSSYLEIPFFNHWEFCTMPINR